VRKRAVIINTAIIFGFVIVMLRLMDIMLLKHGQFYERAKTQQVKQEDVQVRRGILFDRQGRELAVNLELESVYGDPFAMV
jgi:cell division protein FtsI/penicillin-binding protein 2